VVTCRPLAAISASEVVTPVLRLTTVLEAHCTGEPPDELGDDTMSSLDAVSAATVSSRRPNWGLARLGGPSQSHYAALNVGPKCRVPGLVPQSGCVIRS
jgi:hypothetical protein